MIHLILHLKQRAIAKSKARFKAIRAGRKGGKTALEVETIAFKATASIKRLDVVQKEYKTIRKVLYIAPTRIQAEKIVWIQLKNRFREVNVKSNEQKLEMTVPNEDGEKSLIMVGGWENRENYRGLTDVIHITVDEVDTLKNFFLSWKDIFRPLFIDTKGTADFIGTPKKENPNLRRLEKDFDKQDNAASFHFTSFDNPHVPREELELMREEYKGDMQSYQQEVLAEHIENAGALFSFNGLIDAFSNTIDKTTDKYLIVDIAGDGSDKTKFSFWEGLEEYRRETFARMNENSIVDKIREYAASDKIPFSHIAVDAIGIGEFIPKNPLLDGVVGYKGSYSPIKTDTDIVRLPNVSTLKDMPLTTDYKNLRCQCIFTLAKMVNNHEIASRVTGKDKEHIIEELSNYQDASKGDGKRFATAKEDVKAAIGRSPDDSDTWQMRMYFVIMGKMLPNQSEERSKVILMQKQIMETNQYNYKNERNK